MPSQFGADGTFHLPQLISLHRLINNTPDSIRRLPLHPLGGVGVGVQCEASAVVAQGVGEGFHVHTMLQRQGGECMP